MVLIMIAADSDQTNVAIVATIQDTLGGTGICVGMATSAVSPITNVLHFQRLQGVRGRWASHVTSQVYAACFPSCSQMLMCRVSGMRNRLRIRHTAGTAIG